MPSPSRETPLPDLSAANRPLSLPGDTPTRLPADDVPELVRGLVAGDRPFALIRRDSEPLVDLHLGEVVRVPLLADLPLSATPSGQGRAELLALVPYRQLAERDDACHDDHTPLLALRVDRTVTLPVDELVAMLPAPELPAYQGGFDVPDEVYATSVKRVLAEEIGRGEGANFVLRRAFVARPERPAPPTATALAAFCRLLRDERGAYWTFCVHVGRDTDAGFVTLVGASPERHVSVTGGVVLMNPISGTFRTPPSEASVEQILEFLSDDKERFELAMVLDEELKMMAEVSDGAEAGPRAGTVGEVANLGGRVIGPYLKEMARLAHTEYLIEARTDRDVRDVLRVTMFAPTVTGSPLRNALRVIARHEPTGRGYYGGVLALLGHDENGQQTLDAPILIRTAYLEADGTVRVPVGATLVRDSDPNGEVRETAAKGAGVLRALGIGVQGGGLVTGGAAGSGSDQRSRFADDPLVRAKLAERNRTLAGFWLADQRPTSELTPAIAGRDVLVVDGEDAFTAMLTVLLRALGLRVRVHGYQNAAAALASPHDLVVLGPGPGDPGDDSAAKMRTLRGIARERLASGRPLLAICLGHQIVARELGLEVVRLNTPWQGTQRPVDLFGRHERVGFYSTYTAMAPRRVPEGLTLAHDPVTGQVHALRGTNLAGMQYHPESVLTEHGIDLLREEISRLIA